MDDCWSGRASRYRLKLTEIRIVQIGPHRRRLLCIWLGLINLVDLASLSLALRFNDRGRPLRDSCIWLKLLKWR